MKTEAINKVDKFDQQDVGGEVCKDLEITQGLKNSSLRGLKLKKAEGEYRRRTHLGRNVVIMIN